MENEVAHVHGCRPGNHLRPVDSGAPTDGLRAASGNSDTVEDRKAHDPALSQAHFASLLLADKASIPEVSHLLGHKNSAITMKTYAHFTGEETNSVQNLSASILDIS